jgi:hypothetical protein
VLATEVAIYTYVKIRRRLRNIEHPELWVTAAVIEATEERDLQVHTNWHSEKEHHPHVGLESSWHWQDVRRHGIRRLYATT